MMPFRVIAPRDRVDYIRVFNSSKSYQITHTDILSSASDLEVIEQILRWESSDISVARVVRKNESGSKLVEISHPRYMGPQWHFQAGYISRSSWVINNNFNK